MTRPRTVNCPDPHYLSACLCRHQSPNPLHIPTIVSLVRRRVNKTAHSTLSHVYLSSAIDIVNHPRVHQRDIIATNNLDPGEYLSHFSGQNPTSGANVKDPRIAPSVSEHLFDRTDIRRAKDYMDEVMFRILSFQFSYIARPRNRIQAVYLDLAI